MRIKPRDALLAAALELAVASAAAGQVLPAVPSADEALEARGILASMKGSERGPYEGIRWYCGDGSVLPPQGTPCRERGGGVQHAEPSAAARRLAEMGYHVGTILEATSFDDFADEAHAGYRLQELVLERFLFGVDDGWVLRRARYYRGALQIEDEERAGRELLDRRFADGAWLRSNYFLATRLAAALPHTSASSDLTTDRIRNTALAISNEDPGFLATRVKIHSVPSRDDIAAVEAYLRRGGHSEQVREWLVQLRDDLRRHYDPERALASLSAYRGLVPELDPRLARLTAALESGDSERILSEIVDLAPWVREAAETTPSRRSVVDLVDLGLALQERVLALSGDLEVGGGGDSRAAALRRAGQYVSLAYASGYLSRRERGALQEEIDGLRGRGTVAALAYKSSLGYLSRSLDWGRGTVRGAFQPVVDRYVPVEPAAGGLPDALLRGSVLLPLSQVLDVLHSDADARLGAAHSVFGSPEPIGLRGLNPGVAMRPLRTLPTGEHGEEVDAGTIYVLPETPAELKPVAGVLTLEEGNLLSHVQLLARNLGIPNAAISPSLLPRLGQAEGREVFYAVSPLGRVVLAWPDQLGPLERGLVETRRASTEKYHLDTSRLRLSQWRAIPIARLRSTDSGVLVGPKAANVGQLAADFPGRVSDGVALPFGMFRRHVDRPYQGSERSVMDELREAYDVADRMRNEGRPEADVDAYMLERLAWVREAIEQLEWIPEIRREITEAATRLLDGDPSRGLFIRSDTNVEDLPQFSGAGLNLTVMHQTAIDAVLASVKRVWTSPFSERAYLWRKQILDTQGEIYPSVLMQLTVPSEKSGVLITSGLQEGGPDDVMVVAAEGVGGAVDGDDAESLLLRQSGGVRLLSQAKAPQRREPVPGGTRWVAATRPETLLQPGEIAQLRDVVSSWRARKAGTPEASTIWDMEYGFVDGRLWLFQVRPFVRYRNSDLYARLQELDAEARSNADRPVTLSEPLVAP